MKPNVQKRYVHEKLVTLALAGTKHFKRNTKKGTFSHELLRKQSYHKHTKSHQTRTLYFHNRISSLILKNKLHNHTERLNRFKIQNRKEAILTCHLRQVHVALDGIIFFLSVRRHQENIFYSMLNFVSVLSLTFKIFYATDSILTVINTCKLINNNNQTSSSLEIIDKIQQL